MDLFDSKSGRKEPLAARMRPRNLDEYIGQEHIVGKGRLLRRAIAADRLSSAIFYGPPGSGKTTLAQVIANHTKSNFTTLNAVLTGVQDIRNAIKNADDSFKLYSKRTILFVDEVHRWNKSQQDALLPWVENGTIILVGATTENPFFEVNRALVSRSRVFQLKPLSFEDLMKTAKSALLDRERGYGKWRVVFEDGALEHLVETANGDARSLLNALELAVETTPSEWEMPEGSEIFISKEAAEESIQKKVVLYDKDGDYHYDIISAFIKSIRGRDADAALYWLAKMIRAGEDPHFIFRRMLISACEDTGLADPNAISVVESCARAFDRIGLPEGRYHLAHAALYLATAPKSNSSMAFFDALSSVEKEDAEVPNHLRDSSRDAQSFGHGSGYLYPHAYRDHWVAQQYLPDALVGRVFYTPSNQGYEAKIREDVLKRREIQIAAILENRAEEPISDENCAMHPIPRFARDDGKFLNEWWINQKFKTNDIIKEENLTFSPENKSKENALNAAEKSWRARLDSNRAEILLQIRNAMIQIAQIKRHTRSLVLNADDGLLIWELCRQEPEGITCGICRTSKGREILEQYEKTLDEIDRPLFADFQEDFSKTIEDFRAKKIEFDRIFARDAFSSAQSAKDFADSLSKIDFAENFSMIVSNRIPKNGQRIGELVFKQIFGGNPKDSDANFLEKILFAEEKFFSDESNALFGWDENDAAKIFEDAGFSVLCASESTIETRRIFQSEIEVWLNENRSIYAASILKNAGANSLDWLKKTLEHEIPRRLFSWRTKIALFKISRK